jgi:hypothetical protein
MTGDVGHESGSPRGGQPCPERPPLLRHHVPTVHFEVLAKSYGSPRRGRLPGEVQEIGKLRPKEVIDALLKLGHVRTPK